MRQKKRACAVINGGFAFNCNAHAYGGGLLVANGKPYGQAGAGANAVIARRRADLRQRGSADTELGMQPLVPLKVMDIEHQRALGVGGVAREGFAARKPPYDISVQRGRTKAVGLSRARHGGYVFKRPRYFGRGIELVFIKPGNGVRFVLRGGYARKLGGGAAVLPADKGAKQVARFIVPQRHGGPLARNAHGNRRKFLIFKFGKQVAVHASHGFHEYRAVVLGNVGAGKIGPYFAFNRGGLFTVRRERHGAHAGTA